MAKRSNGGHPKTPTRIPVERQLVRAAHAWVAEKEFELDFDHPDLDAAVVARYHNLKTIVGSDMTAFLSGLRTLASIVVSSQAKPDSGTKHDIRRELFLMPLVGSPADAEILAMDAGRMLQLSEIVRRKCLAIDAEDVILLPVVVPEEAVGFPGTGKIRQSLRAVSSYLDDDSFDDELLAGTTAQVAKLLRGRVSGKDVVERFPADDAIQALVGVATFRRTVPEDGSAAFDISEDMFEVEEYDEALEAIAEVCGSSLSSSGPGTWAHSATSAALVKIRSELASLRLRNGISPAARILQMRQCKSDDGAKMLLSFVVDGKVLGPVFVDIELAAQDLRSLLDGLQEMSDSGHTCSLFELMLPADAIPIRNAGDPEVCIPSR
jgi:hypothetical protein